MRWTPVAAIAALLVAACGSAAVHPPSRVASTSTRSSRGGAVAPAPTAPAPAPPPSRPKPPHPPFHVRLHLVTFVDHGRTVPGGRPRTLVTVVRSPQAPGRFPLVVFGHGFAVTPTIYASLLDAWTRAGYVVAAPVFPRENAGAPGGPDESDIVNQPADVSFVITGLLRSDPQVNDREVAVTGQSDGGNTALAVAYGARHRDRRIRAAMILSGGEVPPVAALNMQSGPPLLAIQGTADTINLPSYTHAFFDLARRPRYRLDLLGAPHLPPYVGQAPWASVTARVTTDFLDLYLKGQRSALGRMRAAGEVPGVAALEAYR